VQKKNPITILKTEKKKEGKESCSNPICQLDALPGKGKAQEYGRLVGGLELLSFSRLGGAVSSYAHSWPFNAHSPQLKAKSVGIPAMQSSLFLFL
jgi:hypothetical protein